MLQMNRDIDYPQLETLDDEVALRVARLVVECSAPIDLAIAAVQDATTHDEPINEDEYSNEWFLKRLLFH